LKTDIPISRLRGRFHDYHGIKLMPTYHPAYLLRNPGDKRLVWEDMQLVQKAYHGVAHHAEEAVSNKRNKRRKGRILYPKKLLDKMARNLF